MELRNDPRRPDVPKLTPGSRYRILSMMTRDEPLETEGEFKGYTAIGGLDAICMELKPRAAVKGGTKDGAKGGTKDGAKGGAKDEAKDGAKGGTKGGTALRLIPTQMVISIDIIDQAKETEQEKAGPDSRAYM